MATMSPYINFARKTAEALEFYKTIFGGNIEMQLAKQGPNAANTPPEKLDQVFHAFYNAGDFTLLASDMMSDEAGRVVGNVFSLVLECDSAEQLQTYFDKLSEGGEVVWPVRNSEWGSIYAQVVDKYGLQWMFNFQPTEK